MNQDQVNGKLKDIGGKIQEEAGKLVGSKEQELKGLQNQAGGKMQQAVFFQEMHRAAVGAEIAHDLS